MRDDADTVPVATPAQQDELADRLRAQAAIHLDSRGRRRTGELLLDAADALTAANARVETLEAECVESRIEIDARRRAWDGLQKNPSRPDSALLDIATKILHEYADRVDAARAATGPIGGVA